MSLTRIIFELVDEKDDTVMFRKVYASKDELEIVDALTRIAHIHSFVAKTELLRRLAGEAR